MYVMRYRAPYLWNNPIISLTLDSLQLGQFFICFDLGNGRSHGTCDIADKHS